MGDLDGRRVLVVGASKGIGRSIALRLDADGAKVAAAARSAGRLDEVVEAASGEVVPVVCDVRDTDAAASAVDRAADALGGLDALVYSTGTTYFTELAKATEDQWKLVYETNVIGAGLLTAAALPHLEASDRANAIYLTTEAAAGFPPWRGLGLYMSSKAALEKCVETWNLEHPEIAFTSLIVGATLGTEFSSTEANDLEDVMRYSAEWGRLGHTGESILQPEDHAKAVADILTGTSQMDVVWVRPRGAGRGSPNP